MDDDFVSFCLLLSLRTNGYIINDNLVRYCLLACLRAPNEPHTHTRIPVDQFTVISTATEEEKEEEGKKQETRDKHAYLIFTVIAI